MDSARVRNLLFKWKPNCAHATTADSAEERHRPPVKGPDTRKSRPEEKTVSFLFLEHYIRELCSELERGGQLSRSILDKASPMVKALDDCAGAIPMLSIHFYNLVHRILRDLSARVHCDDGDYQQLSGGLLELSAFIVEEKFTSHEHPVSKYDMSHSVTEKKEPEDARNGLIQRLRSLTAKNIGFLNKMSVGDVALRTVIAAFLLLLCELDCSATVKESEITEDPGKAMLFFTAVPGKAMQVVRQIIPSIEKEALSSTNMRKIQRALGTVDLERLRLKERYGIGLIIYEVLLYTVKYFNQYTCANHGVRPVRDSIKINTHYDSPAKDGSLTVRHKRKLPWKPRSKPATPKTVSIEIPTVSQKGVQDSFGSFLVEGTKKAQSRAAAAIQQFLQAKKSLLDEFQLQHHIPVNSLRRLSSDKALFGSITELLRTIN